MTRYAWVTVWLGCATAAVFAQVPAMKPAAGRAAIDSTRLLMQPEQVVLAAETPIYGDAAKPGMYILRTKLAPQAKLRPRYYDQDRWVTVLKGTWWVGQGDVYRPDKLVPVREGGVMFQPAKLRTYDFAGGGEVVLQVVGNGPVKSVHAEVDAQGQPVAIGGPYPEDAAPETGRGRGRGGRRGTPPPMGDDQPPLPPGRQGQAQQQ